MLLTICAVRDSAVDSFMQPFFVHHVGAAVRSFQDEVNRKDSVFYAHAEDYILFELGQFDDRSGGVIMHSEPRQLGRGQDFKESRNEAVKA